MKAILILSIIRTSGGNEAETVTFEKEVDVQQLPTKGARFSDIAFPSGKPVIATGFDHYAGRQEPTANLEPEHFSTQNGYAARLHELETCGWIRI